MQKMVAARRGTDVVVMAGRIQESKVMARPSYVNALLIQSRGVVEVRKTVRITVVQR